MYLWTKRERKTHPLSQDGEKHDYLHTETFYRLLTVIIYQCLVVTDYGCGVCECLVAQECLILCHPMDSEKAMATQSGTLAWKIPWMEEPGRLQSMGSLRVRHNWANSISTFTFLHWRRKWQPTPVFLPAESQGRGSLVSWRLWGHTESDMTEAT